MHCGAVSTARRIWDKENETWEEVQKRLAVYEEIPDYGSEKLRLNAILTMAGVQPFFPLQLAFIDEHGINHFLEYRAVQNKLRTWLVDFKKWISGRRINRSRLC